MAVNEANDSEVPISKQTREGKEAIENALEMADDLDEEVQNELEIASTLLGAAGIRVSPRLATLRELFHRDYHEVSHNGGPMGEYKLTIKDGRCFHEDRREPLSALGFSVGSTHVHTDDDGTPYMSVYIKDERES